jgi:hypothetical protein
MVAAAIAIVCIALGRGRRVEGQVLEGREDALSSGRTDWLRVPGMGHILVTTICFLPTESLLVITGSLQGRQINMVRADCARGLLSAGPTPAEIPRVICVTYIESLCGFLCGRRLSRSVVA